MRTSISECSVQDCRVFDAYNECIRELNTAPEHWTGREEYLRRIHRVGVQLANVVAVASELCLRVVDFDNISDLSRQQITCPHLKSKLGIGEDN